MPRSVPEGDGAPPSGEAKSCASAAAEGGGGPGSGASDGGGSGGGGSGGGGVYAGRASNLEYDYHASLDAEIVRYAEQRCGADGRRALRWRYDLIDGCVRYAPSDPQLRLFLSLLRRQAPPNAWAEVNAHLVRIHEMVRRKARAAAERAVEAAVAPRSESEPTAGAARARVDPSKRSAARCGASAVGGGYAVAAPTKDAAGALPSLRGSATARLGAPSHAGGGHVGGGHAPPRVAPATLTLDAMMGDDDDDDAPLSAERAKAATKAARDLEHVCTPGMLLEAIRHVCPSLRGGVLARLRSALGGRVTLRYHDLLRRVSHTDGASVGQKAALRASIADDGVTSDDDDGDDETEEGGGGGGGGGGGSGGGGGGGGTYEGEEVEGGAAQRHGRQAGVPLPKAFRRALRDALCSEPFDFVRAMGGMLTVTREGSGEVGTTAIATVATCRTALQLLDPARPPEAVSALLAACFVEGTGDPGLVQTDAQREWREKAIARVDEGDTERVERILRRLLQIWPRWTEPPPDDPNTLIDAWERQQLAAEGGAPREAPDATSPNAARRTRGRGTRTSLLLNRPAPV